MKHQTQPTTDSCVCACLAMLAGKPVKTVIEHYHEKIWSHLVSVEWCLEDLDIPFERRFYEGHSVYRGRVYLASVASLNCQGGLHQVLLDCRGEEMVVLDPAKGIPEKYHYAYQPEHGEDPLAVPLDSWLISHEVVPHE